MMILRRRRWLRMFLLLLLAVSWECYEASSPSPGMILRIRLEDGSMEKIRISAGAQERLTLEKLLSEFPKSPDSKVYAGTSEVKQDEPLSNLGLSNGSIITIRAIKPPTSTKKESPSHHRQPEEETTTTTTTTTAFQPFPELAKDYQSAVRRKARRRSARGGMSYSDLARVQSSLHVVEPQPTGPLKRVYMCRISAERFQSNCVVKKKGKRPEMKNRVGILLGTISRERVDTSRSPKVRTSLSSRPSAEDFCEVAKVHALWEPPQQPSSRYDAKHLMLQQDSHTFSRLLRIAEWLGIKPVGWIFTFTENRLQEDDALPVWGDDVLCGARLQIGRMKSQGRAEGAKFITTAMDANSGATEAFQLSDVSVQMVSEGLLLQAGDRLVETQHPVLIDGTETTQLDSVLCLVNTAMLSQEGIYAGSTTNSVKKNGSLTTKSKKALCAAMKQDDLLLKALCDFNLLLAIDLLLGPRDMEHLCRLVKKWARGQKAGTKVPVSLRETLKAVLST